MLKHLVLTAALASVSTAGIAFDPSAAVGKMGNIDRKKEEIRKKREELRMQQREMQAAQQKGEQAVQMPQKGMSQDTDPVDGNLYRGKMSEADYLKAKKYYWDNMAPHVAEKYGWGATE